MPLFHLEAYSTIKHLGFDDLFSFYFFILCYIQYSWQYSQVYRFLHTMTKYKHRVSRRLSKDLAVVSWKSNISSETFWSVVNGHTANLANWQTSYWLKMDFCWKFYTLKKRGTFLTINKVLCQSVDSEQLGC